jgi:pyruvate dehydrogenase E1 component alpha subunit
VAVGVCQALSDRDAVVSTYREHGHALARGVPMDAVMSEMLGKVTGCSRGRGGSMHLFDTGHRFYGGNAIVGGGLPLATGLALAERLRGGDAVTVCFFGDGAVAEGEFHECCNLAALWDLPLVFCCENNLYAMGTALTRSHAETDLALRAASYGMVSWAVDGMDVEAVARAADRAVDRTRSGGGPSFLELRTYRFRAHSMYDPERYRDKAEVARWRERDPIDLLTARMVEAGELDDAELQRCRAEVSSDIDRAVEVARAGPVEPVADLTRFVYSEPGG